MKVLYCLLFSLCLSAAAHAQVFSSLEERMSEGEFKAAGLDKLTPEELAALNAFLQRDVQGSIARAGYQPPRGDRRGFLDDYREGGPISSRILGEFRGWDGVKTRFTLENGQVWQSTDPSARLAVKLQDPVVTIKPGMLNAWFLSVDGYGSQVRVKRIR